MKDQETNLHPKNNPSIDLKPNIVTGNIPDKAVTFKQLDENLQNDISSHSFQTAKNTADISSLREKIDDEASARESEDKRLKDEVFEYAGNINSNLENQISSNKSAISSLESRTKNLEDTKVIVNTGAFDPTSENPAGQKSIAEALQEKVLYVSITMTGQELAQSINSYASIDYTGTDKSTIFDFIKAQNGIMKLTLNTPMGALCMTLRPSLWKDDIYHTYSFEGTSCIEVDLSTIGGTNYNQIIVHAVSHDTNNSVNFRPTIIPIGTK